MFIRLLDLTFHISSQGNVHWLSLADFYSGREKASKVENNGHAALWPSISLEDIVTNNNFFETK